MMQLKTPTLPAHYAQPHLDPTELVLIGFAHTVFQ